MPKKEPLPRGRPSKRAASKSALKQMQSILDDESETVEVLDDDEPLVPPKKKYKVSHRKSSEGVDRDVLVLKTITNRDAENTLELECWEEELSDEQLARRQKFEMEEFELQKQLELLVNSTNAQAVVRNEYGSVFEVVDNIQQSAQGNIATIPGLQTTQMVVNNAVPSYVMMDNRIGILMPVATVTQPPPLKVSAPYTAKLQVAKNLIATPGPGRGRRPKVAQEAQTKCEIVGCNKPKLPMYPFPTDSKTRQKWIEACGNTDLLGKTSAQLENKRICRKHFLPYERYQKTTYPTVDVHSKPTGKNKNDSVSILATAPSDTRCEPFVDLTSLDVGGSEVDNREVSFNKIQGKTFPSLVVTARPHLRVKSNDDRKLLDAKVKAVLLFNANKFTEWLLQQGLIKSDQKCTCVANLPMKLGMFNDVTAYPNSGGYVWISECCSPKMMSVFGGSLFEGNQIQPSVMLKLIYHWACLTNVQNVLQWVKVDSVFLRNIYSYLRSVCTLALHTHRKKLGGPGVKVEVGVISLGTSSQDGSQRQVKVEVLGIMESTTKLVRLRAVEPESGVSRPKKRIMKILEPIMQWIDPRSTIVTDITVDQATLNVMGFHSVVQNSREKGMNNNVIMDYLRKKVPRMFQNTLSLLTRSFIQQFLNELVWREWFGTNDNHAFDSIIKHLAEQTKESDNLLLRLKRVSEMPMNSWLTTQRASIEKKLRGRPPKAGNLTERPSKALSPDVPQQMVPIESYYYGTIAGFEKELINIEKNINYKCQFCSEIINNNINLMTHIARHVQTTPSEYSHCRYCLVSMQQSISIGDIPRHLTLYHPAVTRFKNRFSCLICEVSLPTPYALSKHMSKVHCPSELPYKCGTCSYRCSNHNQIINHFHREHENTSNILCPFCLRTFDATEQNSVGLYVEHLQKHQRRSNVKRCKRCCLWFLTKEELATHVGLMHNSMRGKNGMVPMPVPRNGIMVQTSHRDAEPGNADIINFNTLNVIVDRTSVCKECGQLMGSDNHFPAYETCPHINCHFNTCCTESFKIHRTSCSKTGDHEYAPLQLPEEMFCVCGFSSLDGNAMAKHLAICERKSAYPSADEAKAASVTHSMLDVLGLVRRPEESAPVATVVIADDEDGGSLGVEDAAEQKNDASLEDPDDVEMEIETTPEGLEAVLASTNSNDNKSDEIDNEAQSENSVEKLEQESMPTNEVNNSNEVLAIKPEDISVKEDDSTDVVSEVLDTSSNQASNEQKNDNISDVLKPDVKLTEEIATDSLNDAVEIIANSYKLHQRPRNSCDRKH